jgi:hypothetical protein
MGFCQSIEPIGRVSVMRGEIEDRLEERRQLLQRFKELEK